MVGVDRHMKVLFMHMQLNRENCLYSHICQNYFSTELLHAYVQYVYIIEVKYGIYQKLCQELIGL